MISLSRIACASAMALAATSLFAQSIENQPRPQLPSQFMTREDRVSRADCPDVQGGTQASTPDDTYGCWARVAESAPVRGSWLDIQIKPTFALVFINGKYVGTAEQFTRPFRPLRIGTGRQHIEFRAPGHRPVSFWITAERGKVTTASGTLTSTP